MIGLSLSLYFSGVLEMDGFGSWIPGILGSEWHRKPYGLGYIFISKGRFWVYTAASERCTFFFPFLFGN